MFTLHAFLPSTPCLSLDRLGTDILALFPSDDAPSLENALLPFGQSKYLVFRWPNWSFSTHYESGENVERDVAHISKTAGNVFGGALPKSRVRAVFASDPSKSYTNHIIWVAEYLQGLPRSVVFDEQQNCLWSTYAG